MIDEGGVITKRGNEWDGECIEGIEGVVGIEGTKSMCQLYCILPKERYHS